MAFTPAPGLRVHTSKFGSGTVVRLTRTGAVVALDRMARLEVDVPLDQLAEVDDGGVANKASPTPPSSVGTSYSSAAAASFESRMEPVAALDEVGFRARRSVEALRFGIVPTHSVGDVTLGYEELEHWVSQQLPTAARSRPTVSEICGPFGTGKSHTMAAIRHIAESRGFVTAHVEVDGNSISLSDPASVLRQLWRTLAAPGLESPTPLVDLNVRAIERGRSLAVAALARFERVRSNLLTIATLKRSNCIDKHGETMELLLSCGDEVTAIDAKRMMIPDASGGAIWGGYAEFVIEPKRLIGLRTDDRPDDFVECLVGYSVLARLAGFEGLVVTIDEFEVEAASLSYQRIERLKGVISALSTWFGGSGPQKTGPLSVFIATVGQEGHIGDSIVDILISNSNGAQHPLSPWSRSAHRQLAEKIFALYCHAYSLTCEFDASLAIRVQTLLDSADVEGSGMIRAFIKRYLAELDTAYGPGAT
ncbi:BREX system ATP-binding domain-containing protein [Gemmatimonas sp.]|uniref:BREX system ATP-binding domain-containing protein n=1 Tax=Gemmatimonas sp. TaxID=1962908 RepID=UPI0035652379